MQNSSYCPSASVFWLLLLVAVGASFSQLLGSSGAGGLPPLRGALGLGADGVAPAWLHQATAELFASASQKDSPCKNGGVHHAQNPRMVYTAVFAFAAPSPNAQRNSGKPPAPPSATVKTSWQQPGSEAKTEHR